MNNESLAFDQAPLPRWEARLRKAMLVLGRLALAYLFFSQLWWKAPPRFGCPSDFSFTTGQVGSRGYLELQRTSGLCDWLGIEQVYTTQPRPFLVADMGSVGGPRLSVDIGLLARFNGLILENIIMPGIRVWGWLIFLAEATIAVTMLLGLFSRFGALVAVGVSAQLMVGLAGIPNPYEWEWSYNLMVILSLLMFASAPGRVFGLDTLLRPRLQDAAARGDGLTGRLARLLIWLT